MSFATDQAELYLEETMNEHTSYPGHKSEEDWKNTLSKEEYRVLRQGGTEFPHTGKYNLHFEEGQYRCKACNTPLFKSDNKFSSGCGWPSFDQALEGAIEYLRDTSHGMIRTETRCANCGSHLGHVFDDGPRETTGQRYCINSVCLTFEGPAENQEE